MRYTRRNLPLSLILISITIYTIANHISSLLYNPGTAITIANQGPLFDTSIFHAGKSLPAGQNHSLVIVTGHLSSEDVSWLYSSRLAHIPKAIYKIGAVNTTLPANKGHEAMVYLTYILDHYPNFPDVVLFIHPHETAWHNDILNDLSMPTTIERLNLNHVVRQGYFNTRCHLDPGCPNWLTVDQWRWKYDLKHKPEEPSLSTEVFHEMHGQEVAVPRWISQPCCAQFAVSGERILGRPREFYERYRQWIIDTELGDETSGRLMEYSYQYLFTGMWEWCPSQHQCYCEGYGVCFEGREEGLSKWLGVLRAREGVDEKVRRLKLKGKKGKGYMLLVRESESIGRRLGEMRDEALKRGKDPRLRAEECGRVWREGDGY